MPSPKKFYTDMAGVLIPLATFAGGLTLATQFIIQCPCSRLEALLGLASQLFLAAPLVLLSIYLLLYRADLPPLAELAPPPVVLPDDQITFSSHWQHALVVCQFVFAGLLICAGFILLAAALFAAEPGAHPKDTAGRWGFILLCAVVLIVIISGSIGACCKTPFGQRHTRNCKPEAFWFAFILFVMEVTLAGLLMGFGGKVAAKAVIQHGCNVDITANQAQSSKISQCQKSYGIYSTPIPATSPTVTSPIPSEPTPIVIVDVEVDWTMLCTGQEVNCTGNSTAEIHGPP